MKFPLSRLHSLGWPLAASLALHAAIVMLANQRAGTQSRPRIEVQLPQMPSPRPAAMPEALLKNTFRDAAGRRTIPPPHNAVHGLALTQTQAQTQAQAQQQRLAAHVFYPPQAVAQGLEGEVRLLLKLDAQGRLLDARVASGSGHDLLDRAALAAAHATGAFPGGSGELILPVVFRLSE